VKKFSQVFIIFFVSFAAIFWIAVAAKFLFEIKINYIGTNERSCTPRRRQKKEKEKTKQKIGYLTPQREKERPTRNEPR